MKIPSKLNPSHHRTSRSTNYGLPTIETSELSPYNQSFQKNIKADDFFIVQSTLKTS